MENLSLLDRLPSIRFYQSEFWWNLVDIDLLCLTTYVSRWYLAVSFKSFHMQFGLIYISAY